MVTDIHLDLLSQVRIASPCDVKWADMNGDDRTRHCGQCDLNVHNIAMMTRDEANAFLGEKFGKGERVCGRLYRRKDGTILTRDCPVGLALVRKRMLATTGRIAAAIGLASIAAWAAGASETSSPGWNEWGWAIRLRFTPLTNLIRYGTTHIEGGRGVSGSFSMPQYPQPPKRSPDEYFGPHQFEW